MISPKLFSSVPHRNRTALLDLAGQLQLFHQAIAQSIHASTGRSYTLFPLGNVGGADWLHAVQQQYVAAARALGIADPVNLADYDLKNPTDWASWTFLLGEETERLRLAAGLV